MTAEPREHQCRRSHAALRLRSSSATAPSNPRPAHGSAKDYTLAIEQLGAITGRIVGGSEPIPL